MAIIQNKRLPGAYIDFQSIGGAASVGESVGLPAFLLPKSWGPDNEYVEVDGGTNFFGLVGKEISEIPEIRESFKGNGRALVYLPTYEGSAKATGTAGTLTVNAKYKGELGNQIAVTVVVETDASVTVRTTVNSRTVDEQVVATGLPESNTFVDFAGTLPTVDATGKLTGGLDGTLTAGAYSDFLAGLEKYDFSHIALGTDDPSVKSLAVAKVKTLRAEGHPIFLVTNELSADYEGVLSVANGITMSDGAEMAAKDAVYWVAAAEASAETNSLTYASYPDAIDCERLTSAEQIQKLNEGQIVFVYRNNRVRILQDINTLTTFSDIKNSDFSKNKIMRTMAFIENQVRAVFEESFLGRFTNTLDGRENLKAAIITSVLDPLVLSNAISYEVAEMTVEMGLSKDTVVIGLPISINDAMEKLYVQVTI